MNGNLSVSAQPVAIADFGPAGKFCFLDERLQGSVTPVVGDEVTRWTSALQFLTARHHGVWKVILPMDVNASP